MQQVGLAGHARLSLRGCQGHPYPLLVEYPLIDAVSDTQIAVYSLNDPGQSQESDQRRRPVIGHPLAAEHLRVESEEIARLLTGPAHQACPPKQPLTLSLSRPGGETQLFE